MIGILSNAKLRGDFAFVNRAQKAISLYAAWDSSNPHASKLMERDIEKGWQMPSEVIEEFEPKLIARRNAIKAEADAASESIRKQMFGA